MKDLLRSAAMAFSMFSIFPMPRVEWKKENMRDMLGFLPLVGAVIGLALWAWFALCGALRFSAVLFAAGMTLLPTLLSGGIHLDGFCDTVDALSSRALPEKKREILKDPRAGAFAVVFAIAYFLLYFALCTELPRTASVCGVLAVQQALSRALGVIASVRFPGASDAGMLASVRDAAAKRVFAVALTWMALCGAAMVTLFPVGGAAALLLGLACLASLKRMSAREFGGMSGDLAGFLIALSQLVMLLGFVFAERMAAVWF